MNVNEKILQLRKARGMTQEQLAENMNVSRQAISKWEVGESIPDTDKIVLLSNIFDVSIDYLLKDDIKDNVTEDDKSSDPTKKHFSKITAVIFGVTLLMMGVAIGYILHKSLPSDDKLIISSQLSGVDNLVAAFEFYPAPEYTDSGKTIKPCKFTVVPKVYVENMTATFMIVTDDGKSIMKEATLDNGTVFSAEVEIPIYYYDFSVTVVFSDGYGKYTQGLMENVTFQENGYIYNKIWDSDGL